MLGPPLLIGDRVFYTGDSGRVRVSGDNLAFIPGVVKWMGRIQECFGNQMIAGVALVSILLNNQASRLRPTHSIPALSDFQGSKLITSLLIFLGIILLHSKEIPQYIFYNLFSGVPTGSRRLRRKLWSPTDVPLCPESRDLHSTRHHCQTGRLPLRQSR